MLAKDLLNYLLELKENEVDFDNLSVHVQLNEKSIGPIATEGIKSLHNGFDWNKGKLILHTKNPVIRDRKGTHNKSVQEVANHIVSIGEGIVQNELVEDVLNELEKHNGVFNSGISMNGMTIISKSI